MNYNHRSNAGRRNPRSTKIWRTTALLSIILYTLLQLLSCSIAPQKEERSIKNIRDKQLVQQQDNPLQNNRDNSTGEKNSRQNGQKSGERKENPVYGRKRQTGQDKRGSAVKEQQEKRIHITLLSNEEGGRLLSPRGNYLGKTTKEYLSSLPQYSQEENRHQRDQNTLQKNWQEYQQNPHRQGVKRGWQKQFPKEGVQDYLPEGIPQRENKQQKNSGKIPYETVTISGKTYTVPAPWAGHRLKAPKFSTKTFAQIPSVHIYNGRKTYIRKSAYQPLLDMIEAARQDGVILQVETAYRDTSFQRSIFVRKFAEGRTWDDLVRYHAPPGYSEHMLGLAVDFYPSGWKFASSAQYRWLRANAGRFGFIESYPKIVRANGLPLAWESWHWCYGDTRRAKSGEETAAEDKAKRDEKERGQTVLLPEEGNNAERQEESAVSEEKGEEKSGKQTVLLPEQTDESDGKEEQREPRSKDEALLKSLPSGHIPNKKQRQERAYPADGESGAESETENHPANPTQEREEQEEDAQHGREDEETIAPLDSGGVEELYRELSEALKTPQKK